MHFRRKTNWIFIAICHLVVTPLFPSVNKPCTDFKLKTENNISLSWYDANFVSLMRWCICGKILCLYVFPNGIVLIQMGFGIGFSIMGIMDWSLSSSQHSGFPYLIPTVASLFPTLSIAESRSEKDSIFYN